MRNIRRTMLALIALLISSVALVNVASAQANACVSLLVGAGYAAQMRITSEGRGTEWSHSFPIGRTVCQSLASVADGKQFSVEVHAILGKTETCRPSNVTRVAASRSNVTYQAWGTTGNVQCEEPSLAANTERDAATMTVSPEGQKAAVTAGSEKQ